MRKEIFSGRAYNVPLRRMWSEPIEVIHTSRVKEIQILRFSSECCCEVTSLTANPNQNANLICLCWNLSFKSSNEGFVLCGFVNGSLISVNLV